jgi:L-aminopeptidase/D-esterase-like protein
MTVGPDGTAGRLTDVPGVAVGHWTHAEARTGCTVVLLPEGTVASGEVRGGAPASREVELLHPTRSVDRIDAVVLTGGSAFGLAAADGVVAWLEAAGRGFPTPAGPVPIVPTMGVFDLMVGDGSVRPGPAQGRAACEAASTGGHDVGVIGVGAGCTVDKWRGVERVRPGGVVAASASIGDVVVAALVAVNAFGGIDVDGTAARGAPAVLAELADRAARAASDGAVDEAGPPTFGNTTVGVVATNARLDKNGCLLLAQSAHDGLARAVFPAHSRVDGDAFVAAATGAVVADLDRLRVLVVAVVHQAIIGLGAG